MRIFIFLGYILLVASVIPSCPFLAEDLTKEVTEPVNGLLRVCPPHSQVRSLEPGKCPACGMALKPRDQSESHGDHEYHYPNERHEHSMVNGMYGSYPIARETSGTSWQPDSAPHDGLHVMKKEWMLMLHGFGEVTYDRQGGDRGAVKTFSSNMFMFMATRPLGPGTVGFRTMVSAEPLTIGKNGYPLLLQTGETADGRTPLIDRQHPHDLFMELAVTYSFSISDQTSLFGYFGLPGEPALGPPIFIHRFSGEEIPEAPISHHWLDSTHVTYGVATLGLVRKNLKLEGSVFKGREPDERRFNIESPKFDSYAFRFSFNPTADWALQASFGHLRGREQLEPDVNTDRVTISAIYNKRWNQYNWQTLLAWGRNIDKPLHTTDAFLLESTLAIRERHTLFGRVERTDKDELFGEGDPRAGEVFNVGKGSLGYVYDFFNRSHLKAGLGALGSVALLPAALKPSYAGTPLSGMLFLRLRLK